ncbi:MAG: hypothetical protein ABEI96_01930 [Haloarculaceae archaeon]
MPRQWRPSNADSKPLSTTPNTDWETSTTATETQSLQTVLSNVGNQALQQAHRSNTSDHVPATQSQTRGQTSRSKAIYRQEGSSCWLAVTEAVLHAQGYDTRYLASLLPLYRWPHLWEGVDQKRNLPNIERRLEKAITALKDVEDQWIERSKLEDELRKHFKRRGTGQVLDAIDATLGQTDGPPYATARLIAHLRTSVETLERLQTAMKPNLFGREDEKRLFKKHETLTATTTVDEATQRLRSSAPCLLGSSRLLRPTGARGIQYEGRFTRAFLSYFSRPGSSAYESAGRTIDFTQEPATDFNIFTGHAIFVERVETGDGDPVVVYKDPVFGDVPHRVPVSTLLRMTRGGNEVELLSKPSREALGVLGVS